MQPDCGGRVVATENLSVQARRLVERYREIGGHGGILIGAMHGDADWDWRPLLLERGIVHLLRFSDPVLAGVPEKFELFRDVLKNSRSIPGIVVGDFGSNDQQFWVKRQFFREILSDENALEQAGSLVRSREGFMQVVNCVQQLHRMGIIHGHICADNVAISGRCLELLDVCFYVFSRISLRKVIDVAPELLAGEPASEMTDIYGLGQLAAKLLYGDLSDHEKELLARMVLEDPNQRPSLAEISFAFRDDWSEQQPPVEIDVPVGGSTVKMAVLHQPVEKVKKASVSTPVQPSNVGRVDRSQPSAPPSWSTYFVLLLLLCLGSAGYILYQRYSPWLYYRFSGSAVDDAAFERFWKSGMPSLMQQVAKAALADDNPAARLVIIRDALESKEADGQVRYGMLRIVFNPEWEGELSADDRRIALSLALADLLGDQFQIPALPSLDKVHPGVILAIAGNLAIEKELGQLKQASLTRMVGLPGRYGAAFDILLRLGVESMAEPAARALSHLLLGSIDERVVRAFFAEDEEPRNLFIKLELVLMLSGEDGKLAQEAYKVLMTRHPLSTQLLQWFQLENIAGWEKVSDRNKLVLISGTLPKQSLQVEQYVDLLKFPRETVRSAAKEWLIQSGLPKTMLATIDFLLSEQSLLTRSQTITLVAALTGKTEQQYKVLSDWLKTGPDPGVLVNLLIIRSNIEPTDPFNVTVARHLSKVGWSGDLSQLKKLTMHSEPLVRALAYSLLSVEKQAELNLLKDMVKVEPDQRLRQQLQERLKDW